MASPEEKFCVLMKFNHQRARLDHLINEHRVSPKINYFSLKVFCMIFFQVSVYIYQIISLFREGFVKGSGGKHEGDDLTWGRTFLM